MKTIGHAIGVAAKQVSSAALRQRPAAAAAVASTPTAPNGSVTPWAARCISSSMARQSNPSDNRRGSEGTMAGAGSTDEIADSKGAFSPDSPRPDQAASQISSEKPGISFESSAASNGNAERASPQHNGGKATSADGSNPPQSREDLGGLRQRKEANKKM